MLIQSHVKNTTLFLRRILFTKYYVLAPDQLPESFE